jgi:outer membrane protein assembly factor BamB
LWTYSTGGVVFSSPAVANGVVYVSSFDYNVYALNASTGVKLWSYFANSNVAYCCAVANGVVYFTEGAVLRALNASTGAKLWGHLTYGAGEEPAVVANGMIYVGSPDRSIYAFGLK